MDSSHRKKREPATRLVIEKIRVEEGSTMRTGTAHSALTVEKHSGEGNLSTYQPPKVLIFSSSENQKSIGTHILELPRMSDIPLLRIEREDGEIVLSLEHG